MAEIAQVGKGYRREVSVTAERQAAGPCRLGCQLCFVLLCKFVFE